MSFAVLVGSAAAPALINSIRDVQIRGNYFANDTGNHVQLDMVTGVVLLNNLWGSVSAGYNRIFASTNTTRVLLIDTSIDSNSYLDDNIRDNSSDGIKMFSNRRTVSGILGVPGGDFTVGVNTMTVTGGRVGIGTGAPRSLIDADKGTGVGQLTLDGSTGGCVVPGCKHRDVREMTRNDRIRAVNAIRCPQHNMPTTWAELD